MEEASNSNQTETGRQPDSAAQWAGLSLVLAAVLTVVAVVGRVAADADQPTLSESLVAISESGGLYALGGLGRLLSGVTLLAGAWYLTRTWIIRERLGTPAVPWLFAVSGAFTAISGASALGLAVSGTEVNSTVEAVASLRWLTGKIGFSAAGLALIIAARYQWKVGGTLRYIAPVSALIGVVMQLIWIDAAIIAHRVSGPAFSLWLVAIGLMLATGRVERHFVSMSNRDAAE